MGHGTTERLFGPRSGAGRRPRCRDRCRPPAHMQKVFGLMGMGTAVTGLVAYFTSQSPAMLDLIYNTPLRWVVMLAPLGFVLVLSFGINCRMRASTAQLTSGRSPR